jgi:hypothetical protein
MFRMIDYNFGWNISTVGFAKKKDIIGFNSYIGSTVAKPTFFNRNSLEME